MSARLQGPRAGVEAAWGRDGLGARLLAPLGWIYGAMTGLRNLAYDAGVFRAHPLALPAVSVGNLSVGGTGKTPVAAWLAQWFLARGVRPAIVMRGYGDDEPLVHRRLTPAALVVADPDRVRGTAAARAQGAQVVVLDDAFQHRRARRDADLVLVAAEQRGSQRLLPSGPFREGPSALRRAHAIVVTRKSASAETAAAVLASLARHAPGAAQVVVALTPGELVRAAGTVDAAETLPAAVLAGRRVLAVSAIGAPAAFAAQLAALGADVVPAEFADHHPFSATDVAALASRGGTVDFVVCTLKDAVKLAERWPPQAPPLWYLSQAVVVERGGAALDALLARIAAAASS